MADYVVDWTGSDRCLIGYPTSVRRGYRLRCRGSQERRGAFGGKGSCAGTEGRTAAGRVNEWREMNEAGRA